MSIEFKEAKDFTAFELESLFKSVGWISGNYPVRLAKAIKNSSTVISAWADDRLIGLVNALDDGELTCYAHYLLVRPEYQGQGIGKALIQRLKKKYADYLYLMLICEEEKTVAFYQKLGFEVEKSATPVCITNL